MHADSHHIQGCELNLTPNLFLMDVTDLRQESGRGHGLHPPELCDGRRAEVEVRRGDVLLVRHVVVVVGCEHLFVVRFALVLPAYNIYVKRGKG